MSETDTQPRLLHRLLSTEAMWSNATGATEAQVQWQRLCLQLPRNGSPMFRFDTVLDVFYQQALFTPPLRELTLQSLLEPLLVQQSILQREGDTLVLALLLGDLFQAAGLEVKPLWYQDKLLLQIRLSAAEKIWLEPSSGQWQTLLKPENGLVGTLEDELQQLPCCFDELAKRLWLQQKQLYLLCGETEKALQIMQHLLSKQPDDAFLRRERALVLELLDHFALAISDYQYFLEQRPDDPLNEQIQQQIRQLSYYSQSLH